MSTKRRWQIAVVGATVWVLILFPWLPNRSFEHYPFSGPLVSFLYSSPIWPDRLVGAPITAVWLFAIFYPIVRPNVFTVALSALSIFAWFSLSIWAAAIASC